MAMTIICTVITSTILRDLTIFGVKCYHLAFIRDGKIKIILLFLSQKNHYFSIFQSFNLSIFQSFNLSIFQSFNLSIFQSFKFDFCIVSFPKFRLMCFQTNFSSLYKCSCYHICSHIQSISFGNK